jgi:hypothetical protein
MEWEVRNITPGERISRKVFQGISSAGAYYLVPMKIPHSLRILAAASAVLFATSSFAADSAPGKLVPVTEKEADWAAEASKNYPLDVCVGSGEKLGSMGDATEWIYRAEGQADRLVKFCCDGCIDTFMDAPAEHLAKIDAAAKKKAAKAAKAAQ